LVIHSPFVLSEIPDTIKYTIDRWRVVKLVEDAYTKRIQDTLIDSLNSQIRLLEQERQFTHKSFTKELAAERAKVGIQSEMVAYEKSMKEYYLSESKKYKRQKSWLVGTIGIIATGIIAERVLIPP
jgi:hypothetical protein